MVLDFNTLKALGNYVEEVGSVESVIETYQNARQKYYEDCQHLIHSVEDGHEELTKQQHQQNK